ncbi:DUF5703 family protein, partial [Kitasatospora sp. NPDC047058]|uniref:DUF5703 family protein n=1 Tax=Kitasatospora sp. NPDC047058 TaxID=3155620 RepID=UPI003409B325
MTPAKPVRQPEYEYQSLRMPRGTSRNAARQLLTDHAEYGHWELDSYDLTGSSFATGLVGLFSLFPLVAFGLYGGAV